MARAGMLTMPSPRTSFSGAGVISQLPGTGGSPSAQVMGTRSSASTFNRARSCSVLDLTTVAGNSRAPIRQASLPWSSLALVTMYPSLRTTVPKTAGLAVAKDHDRAAAGLGGDGGDVAEKRRARFAVIGGRGTAPAQQAPSRSWRFLAVSGVMGSLSLAV